MTPVIIDQEQCVGCGLCVKDCVAGFLSIRDGKAVPKESGCIRCGHCYAICPQNAVTVADLVPDSGEYVTMDTFDSQQLLQAMKSRRTIRQFKPDRVEPEKVGMILEAGRYSPTGSNAQDVAYTILGSKQAEMEKMCVELFRKGTGAAGKFSDAMKNYSIDDHFFFKGAPLVIVVSAKSKVNAGLASSFMELMAESLGLGVLYSGFFCACTMLNPKLKSMLDLPTGHKVVTCMVIGYPNVSYRRIPGRKPAKVRTL